MIKLRKRVVALAAVTSIAVLSGADANPVPPSWYQGGWDYSYSGTLGMTDIDVGILASTTPKDGYLVIPGLYVGQEWYAWMQVDLPGAVVLTSWTGFTPGPQGTQLVGETKLDADANSSHLGPAPALAGHVLDDGTVSLVICAVVDPNCSYQNGSSTRLDVNYTFYFALQQTPLPASLPLFLSGIGAMYAIKRRSLSKAKHAGAIREVG